MPQVRFGWINLNETFTQYPGEQNAQNVSSRVFEIRSLCLDAASESGHITVQGIPPLMSRNLTNFMVDGVHELLGIWEQMSADMSLQDGEQPIVWWVQIWTICWMWDLRESHLLELSLDRIASVCRSTVMKNSPAPASPDLRPAPADGVTQLLKDLQVKLTIHTLTLRNKTPVDKPEVVKKDDQHHLLGGLLSHWHCRRWCIGSQPLAIFPSGRRIPHIEPTFITTNHTIYCSIPSQSAQSSTSMIHPPLFLRICEMMGDPVGTLLLEGEVFAHCSEGAANAQISSLCNLADGLSLVLLDNLVDMLNFCWIAPQQLSGSQKVIHLVSAIFKG